MFLRQPFPTIYQIEEFACARDKVKWWIRYTNICYKRKIMIWMETNKINKNCCRNKKNTFRKKCIKLKKSLNKNVWNSCPSPTTHLQKKNPCVTHINKGWKVNTEKNNSKADTKSKKNRSHKFVILFYFHIFFYFFLIFSMPSTLSTEKSV